MSERKSIRDLDNLFPGETIYIVGTGPSMKYFPPGYLKGKLTIGLNQAWRYLTPTFCITIHPSEYNPAVFTNWIVKEKGLLKNIESAYFFWQTTKGENKPLKDCLYTGYGIHVSALHLVERMGAKTAILVGCDFRELQGQHHGHTQHPPRNRETIYDKYYYATTLFRKILNINILNLHAIL